MVHAYEVLWQGENGGTTWEISHRCCIMRKVIWKEMGAGGRFYFFLHSGLVESSLINNGIKMTVKILLMVMISTFC